MNRGLLGVVRRAAFGAGKLAVGYWWVALVSLGFLPALLFSRTLLRSVAAADWSCSGVAFGASGGRSGGCSTIAGEFVVTVAVSWLVPLFVLLALLYLLRRSRRAGDDAGVVEGGAGSSEAGLDPTALFVRVVAVLLGLASAIAIGDPIEVVGSAAGRSPALMLGHGLVAVLAGPLASEVVLRMGRQALGGGFLARYGVAVLGLCLGGASWVLGAFFGLGSGAQGGGPEGGVLFAVYALLAYGLISALVGAVLGGLEGLVLGLPLAAVLGVLRRPPRGRGHAILSPSRP